MIKPIWPAKPPSVAAGTAAAGGDPADLAGLEVKLTQRGEVV